MDRPLDGMETVYYAAGSVARINVVCVARVRGPLDPALLRRALDAAQRRHPLLGVHVEERSGVPRFVSAGTPAIPLRVEERRGEAHWHEEAEAALDDRFDLRAGPMMRCVLLRGDGVHDLLLPFHHLIGDGMAGISVVQDLLAAHANLAAGKETGLEPLPELPPMRDLSPLNVRGLAGRALVLREVLHILGVLGKAKPQVLRWDARVPRAQRHTRLLHIVLPAEVAAGLAARAKQERTTVTGAIAAALLRALAEDVGGAPTVMCSIPANLRPHLAQIPAEAFGYYTWGFGTIQPFPPGRRFWDVARAVRGDVDAELARGGLWRGLAIMEWQGPRTLRQGPEKLLRSLDKSGANSVSNLGRVEVPERFGDLAWEDLHFCGSADGAGAGVGLLAVTFRGRTTLNFVHPVPLVAEARGDRIARRTVASIEEAVAGDPAVGGGPGAQPT